MATFEEMREKHRRDSMLTLSFFMFLLLVFAFDRQYTDAVARLIRDPTNLADALKNSWLVAILTLIGPVATYFLGIITIARRDFYYPIDDMLFKRRIKVERFICQEMLRFRIALTDEERRALDSLSKLVEDPVRRRQIMSLFYRYIEKAAIVNPELKSQAFVYWGDYFSAMMLVVWGVLTLVAAALIAFFDKSVTGMRLVIALLMLLLVCMSLRGIVVGKTGRKQFEIPETQIREIHRGAAQDLLAELRDEGFFLGP
jgi:Na+-transporting methylmalonyl-CoA/oxaloacetate decarboxylase gamma subunit